MSEKLTPCPSCQAPINPKSEWCPSCGRKTPFYDFVLVKEKPEEVEDEEASPVRLRPTPQQIRDKIHNFSLWAFLFIGMAILLIYCYFAPDIKN